MNKLRLSTTLVSLFVAISISVFATSSKPDFAYPQTVSSNAEKELKAALKTGNGQEVVKSLVDFSIAQSLIDADNLPNVINRIETITNDEKDPCIKAILYTLLTDIYIDIYNTNRWKYDNRNNTLLPLPADYNTWDGKQFEYKITGLCDAALSNPIPLQSSPLKNYKTIITQDNNTLIYYPTLYDFIARHTIKTLNNLAPTNSVLSFSWLCRYDVYSKLKFNYTSPIAKRILSLYQDLLAFNAQRIAPFIDCDLQRIDFLQNAVYSDGQSSSKTSFQILQELYYKYAHEEYSGDIILAMNELHSGINDEKWLYDIAKAHIKKFPAYIKVSCLKNMIESISSQSVEIDAQCTIVPGDTLNLNISNHNIRQFSIDIYRIPDAALPLDDRYNYRDSRTVNNPPQLVQSIPVVSNDTLPFKQKTIVKTVLNKAGCYFIIPNVNNDKFSTSKNYKVIHCTNLELQYTTLYSTHTNKRWASVLNPLTGVPVNADIYQLTRNKHTKLPTINGKAQIPSGSSDIYAKDSVYSKLDAIYIYNNESDTRTIYSGNCFTDIAIYHPGDTVTWSAIVYSTTGKKQHLLANERIQVTIRDANYQEKDTTSAITDEWGRITGTFAIPADGLTGNYNISFKINNNYYVTGTSFMVSDYKLPTYQVTITEILNDSPSTGSITIKGKAESYSGFPIADANVTLNLSSNPRLLWWRQVTSKKSFYSTETTTLQDGTFAIVLPADLLENAPIPNGIFNAGIKVVSLTGESQETNKSFTRSKAYNIMANLADDIEISSPVKLPVKVDDINNNSLNDTILYKITLDKKVIHSGTFLPNSPIVDWSHVPSGKYNITFALKDSTLAEPKVINDICLYRTTDAMPPTEGALWIPVKKYTVDNKKAKASILYGTTATNSHIKYMVWDGDKIHSEGWLTPKKGLHHFDVSIPTGSTNATVTFFTLNNYKSHNVNVDIEISNSVPGIKLNIESFRDKIIPGATETWTFRVTDNTGNGSKSALIFDMYSKALDEILPHSLKFNPVEPEKNLFYFSNIYPNTTSYRKNISKSFLYDCISITTPAINTYGRSFSSNRSLLTDFGAEQESVIIVGSTGAKPRKEVYNKSLVVQEEASADNSNVFYSVEQGESEYSKRASGAESETQNDNFSYRMAETPLAFFKPLLTTDDNGHLSFSFTAPNANTTWRFCAIAYNARLLSDNIAMDVVSNKPIMVQPNMPRFLRTGDSINIQASVMNNSDSTAHVSTVVEIFDHATNDVLHRYTFADTISAGHSTVVTTPLHAPFDTPMIGYRIKSSTELFADGEQSLIAILPSSTPVIETKAFYMAPDSTSTKMQLPEMQSDARVTLQFCENPVWYCVTALPGLRSEDARTSLSATAAIFSAAIAEGIMRNNPDIALAMKQWQTSDHSDSTLTSLLERNQDLKTVLLNATPWVMDARSDTERMTRLALLFDRDEIQKVYSRNIKLLGQLQRGKGGWAWIAESENPSEWCTLNILELCGELKQMGYLPKDKNLNTMIENAVKYIDDVNARQYAQHPRRDYSQYVYTRDFFNEIKQSTAASRVTKATVQRIISDWRNQDASGKATSAIILNKHQYHSTAGQILASLREYAKTSETMGMWWPSLDEMTQWSMGKIGATALILKAFNTIEPTSPDIDLIRQWLILQKEAKNWGTSVTTSQAIASIINSGTKWTTTAHGAIIKINGNDIAQSRFEKTTGYFRQDISQMQPSGAELSIIKTTKTPSWGAVYCQYTDSMAHIAPVACEAVSIEKHFYLQIVTPEGIKWEPTDSFTVGDKVKVELSIKSTRDMDYVAIIDDRAACFEPVEQLPRPIFTEGIYFYRENRDASTNIFVTHLPKGTYLLSYELYTNNSGKFTSGIASLQSQYAPSITAHSAGAKLVINPQNP